MMAPPTQPTALSPEEEMIMGMEGLSEDERKALIDEQRQIMEQIEREKAANEAAIAAAAADDFDSRSAPAVAQIAGGNDVPMRTQVRSTRPAESEKSERRVNLGGGQEVALHGPERTKAAIEDGTAAIVQCMNCENWMQVTSNATLMYCPVCKVVCPVEHQNTVYTQEEAAQMTADRKLAEELQQEEYAQGMQEEEPREHPQQKEESWMDTLSGIFSTKPLEKYNKAQQQHPQRSSGGIGQARSGRGVETVEFASSERDGLLGPSARLPAARVAESQPLFSCVVDSVSSAAASIGEALNTQTLHEDSEGNVHGVDSSSLLAMSDASRAPTSDYSQLPNNDRH
jgi:uncharacterized membrane protein